MGKGGRGKGYDGGGKGKDEPEPSLASHYFGAAAAEDEEEKQRVKQEMKLKKKLRELEALEKRRDAGEKLESLQLKKLETKASIEEELRQLAPKPKPKVAIDLDDDTEDKVEDEDPEIPVVNMDEELAAIEEAKADLDRLSRKPARDDKGKGKSKGGKGGKPSSGQPKQVVAPTISMRQQQAQAAAAKGWGGGGPAQSPASAKPSPASAKPSGVVERMFIPQGDEEGVQQEMFENDLEMWALKFECSSKIEGKEVVARFIDPDINVSEAMAELREIMKFNFPGAYK